MRLNLNHHLNILSCREKNSHSRKSFVMIYQLITKDSIVNNQIHTANSSTQSVSNKKTERSVQSKTNRISTSSTCAVQVLKPLKHATVNENYNENQINWSSATNTSASNLIPRTANNSSYINEFKKRQRFYLNFLEVRNLKKNDSGNNSPREQRKNPNQARPIPHASLVALHPTSE